jgi:peptidyl-prolyl cis-trans isomerase C
MTPYKNSISALIFSALILPIAYADEDKTFAIINGDPVKTSELLTYAKVKNPRADLNNEDTQKQMIQAYVGRELLYQEAITQKLDQLPIVKLALENQRHEIISQALIANIIKQNPVTEEQLRSVYDQKVAKQKDSKNDIPTFEQIKPQIANMLYEQSVTKYIQTLKQKAKIEKP